MDAKTILLPLLILSLTISANSQTAEVCYENGFSELENKRYIEAKGWFDKALELNQEYEDAYFNRGLSNMYLEEYENALHDFKEAAAIGNDSLKVMSYVNIAYALRNKTKKPNEALYYAELAISLDSVSWPAWFIHGLTLHDLQENKKAIISLDKAITINSNDPELYYSRAVTKTGIELFAEAVIDYDRTLELDPNYVSAYNNSGYVKILQGDYEGALEDLNASLKLEVSSYSHNNRGYVKLKLGDYQGAMKDCEIAMELDSSNSWAYHYLGLVYYELGKKEKACELFHRSVELGKEEVVKEIVDKCN